MNKLWSITKRVVSHILFAPAVSVCTNFVVTHLRGGRIRHQGRILTLDSEIVLPWVKNLIFWGMYESAELRLIDRHLPNDVSVIELGGSLGIVTSHIANRIVGSLVTVEADPRLISMLAANAGPTVTVVNAAISYDSTHSYVGIDFGESSLSGRISSNGRPDASVPRITLSGLISKHRIGAFALVSDIEGGEIGIFRRDAAALTNCHLIIIELHEATFAGCNFTINDTATSIVDLGYRLIDQHHNVFVFRR